MNFFELPPATQVAWIGVGSALIGALFLVISKQVERMASREAKQSEDISKFRADLLNRIQHLEGRLDQIGKDNILLVRENEKLLLRVESYREEIDELKKELEERDTKFKSREADFDKSHREMDSIISDLRKQLASM